ncbi:hypothetical protein V8E54_010197 [Elaphomyces granulatus]|jgi:hypothetical protein
MRLGATLLAALAVGTTTVSALQNIYIGTIGGCGSNKYGPDWWVWFIDGPACTTGTDVGPTQYFGNELCGKNVTILGHQFITFTGCPPPPYGGYIPGPPTGVSDDGAPALTCSPVTLPNQDCPSPCGSSYPDVTVTTNYWCS